MISRPRRTRILTLLAAVCCFTALPCVAAQELEPPTAAGEIILGTKTPLGDATIAIPAGSSVADFTEDGEMIVIRRGPFHARVPRAQLVFPVREPDPEPSPAAEVAPARETAPDQNLPTAVVPPTSAGAALWPWEEEWSGDWQRLWPAAAVLLLGLYSLAVTAVLLRRRRRDAVVALARGSHGPRSGDQRRPLHRLPALWQGHRRGRLAGRTQHLPGLSRIVYLRGILRLRNPRPSCGPPRAASARIPAAIRC